MSPEIARRTVINRDHHRTPTEPEGFLAALRAVLEAWAPSGVPPRVTVAFSGGLDSTVLLAALCRLELPVRLRAAHVDHGLNESSASWSERCAAEAEALGVEFVTVRVAVDRASGRGLEAAARDVRYGALRELLEPGEWLLTAHHGDDQLETLLLRMLRGTGVRGLRGIIAFGPFGAGSLGRPLLKFTRAELHARAVAWNLRWLEDPSNRESRHDRNYLRHEVLPALLARWPGAAQQAERLAEQMDEAEQLLDAVAAEDARVLAEPRCVPRVVLAGLDSARQRNLLRHLVRRVGIGVPSARKIDELRHALLTASAESHPLVRWSSGEGRVFREQLHLLAPLPPATAPGYTATIGFGETWAGPEGRVGFVPAPGSEGLPESWLRDGLTLRFRSGGERFRPRGRRHHQTLKQLFQQHAIVPWMRERIPLLYRGSALAAVGDLWVSADVEAASDGGQCWRMQWADHPPLRAPGQR